MGKEMFLRCLVFLLYFSFIKTQEPFKFLVSPFNNTYKSLYVHFRDNVTISCKTNDPTANVSIRMDVQTPVKNEQRFTAYNVNVHNTGKIMCLAVNNDGVSISLELGTLRVNKFACIEEPVITPKQLTYIYEKNDNFRINCEAPGSRRDVAWTKNNQEIDSMIQSNPSKTNKYVIFTNASKDIQGVYTCTRKLRNCKDEDTRTKSITLKYTEPFKPVIKTLPTTSHTVKKGSNLTITCSTEGSPMPHIMWIRDHIIMKDCGKSKICNLDLRNVHLSHEYTCKVVNSEGSAQQNHTVTVLIPPSVKQGLHDSNKGRMFQCKLIEANPVATIFWQQLVACSAGQSKCKEQWRNVSGEAFRVSTTGDISDIEFLDRETYGTFRCVAVNMIGEGHVRMVLPKNSPDGFTSKGTIVGVCLAISTIIVICMCFILCYRKHMMKKFAPYLHPDPKFKLDPDRTLFQQSIELPYEPEWEFPRDRLDLIKSLGSGAFGQVWLAHARGILALSPRDKDSMAIRRRTRLRMNKKVPKTLINCFLDDDLCEQSIFVAVKTLKSDASDVEYKDLASEIKVLIHLGSHENIVNLLGACTKDGSLCAIMEFCPHGNLVNFLRQRRDIFSLQWARQGDNYDEDFCFLDATHVAFQISCGMQFLAQKKLVHRDLAARNILVGTDYVIKIADFGLTRDIEKKEFYLKESGGMLPVKWMAPESLFDKLYTIKSDVWSFGIVLWEITTMGGSPYPGLPMENLFDYLRFGNRMEKPGTCPDELYNIMSQCWSENMNERPNFNELSGMLEGLLKSKAVYTDNLATFERLQSCSDETDYLVPKSPVKKKKGSLDTMLGLNSMPSPRSAHRKRSAADVLLSFPPMDDTVEDCEKNNNSSKLKDNLSPVCENRYVDLQSSDKTDTCSETNETEDTKC